MELVNFLASFWGFTLIVICLSILIKPKQMQKVFVAMENEAILLWLGAFTIMLGIASVLAYNVWDSSWKVVITIINWLVIVKGAYYLFMPESTVKMMIKFKNQYMNWLPTLLVVGVILGCVLVYFGMSY